MSDECRQLLVVIAAIVMQSYAASPWQYPVFAYVWDFIARVTGWIANVCGFVAVQARYNYYVAVNDGS